MLSVECLALKTITLPVVCPPRTCCRQCCQVKIFNGGRIIGQTTGRSKQIHSFIYRVSCNSRQKF